MPTHFHHAWRIYAQLPMKAKTILPDEGCGPMSIEVTEQGQHMEVKVLPKPKPGVQWGHRVLVHCPMCARWVPFGRMNQHWPVHFR